MKRILTLLTLLVLLPFASGAMKPEKGQTAATRHYVIGFYNLENLFDIYNDPAKNDEEYLPEGKNQWTEVKYNKKLHNMATVIRAMHDDNGRWHTILGISEIENRLVIEDLISQPEIEAANYQIIHYDGPDRRGVDVALLYKPEQFSYITSESIPFNFVDTKVEITLTPEEQDYFRTRDILMVRGTIDGEMFAFFVTHTPSRVGGKGGDLRSRCAEIIYNRSRELEAEFPGIKIVVMGDMNDDPFDESMSVWLHGRETIEEMKPEDFFNPYLRMLKDGYGTLCYQGVWSIFDQELVNYNLAVAPEGGLKIIPIVKGKYYGRVFKKPFMTTQKGQYKGYPFRTFSNGAFINGYSDHYPTYIVISK